MRTKLRTTLSVFDLFYSFTIIISGKFMSEKIQWTCLAITNNASCHGDTDTIFENKYSPVKLSETTSSFWFKLKLKNIVLAQ